MKTKKYESANKSVTAQAETAAKLSRSKRMAFTLLPFVVFLLILLLVEIIVRTTMPKVGLLEAVVDSPQLRMGFTDRTQTTIFEGDPLLIWRLKPNLDAVVWDFTPVSTNSQGLRYEGEIGKKTEGAFRIVSLGDSVTFGYRVPVVWPERPNDYARDWLPYPALVEKSLRAANAGQMIDVAPLAVPGYTSHQGLALLRRDISRLQPDVVVACFGWNDANTSEFPDSQTMPNDFLPVTIRRLMIYSQAFTHAALWLNKKDDAPKQTEAPPPTQRVPVDQYVANFIEMARTARAHGAKFVALAPVYRDRVNNSPEGNLMASYRQALRAAMEREGAAYLEIPELTESAYPSNEALFGEAIHPNHLGHRLMATELLKFFAANNTLKGLNVPQQIMQ